ncbi:alpha-amylase family glycosyl hydrolase [Caulobacter sp. 17J80-11]|uniref:alpha-amylase family glycosyl hydrolase n=1 Tax=Caulobacter sp. 17J80-11 TaxID=2763502 RepID=UPI0016536B6C|nr:alpha-amylase family glycosyl hydrolase [Caulobacter sp. 17J80-11]MBC6981927.1 DUF3459 domain-containing protein [Caulobacter sp. 17J80-11]
MSWWRSGVIYQVYPRSFQDGDGDGVGDLAGLRRRLPYLAELGIDAIWLSPVFPSPMADFGYDVADYCGIDPLFGDLDQFDALAAEARALGLKLIMDFVPNHTSERHPWFVEALASRENPRRDWYVWRDPAPGGGPPNNWLSSFGGPAWTFDPASGQYYLHSYLREQPDLNWRNPRVRAAMYDVLRFWMRRGVDGFRVDVLWRLIKDADFRDDPVNPAWTADRPQEERLLPLFSADQAEVHDVVAELRRVVDEFPDRVLIGEIYLPLERLVTYYGRDLAGAHLPFNFLLLETAWRADAVAALVEAYEAALPDGGWPNWVLSNHDRLRVAARAGERQARVAAMLLTTLRGTPTLYYGDELGLGRVPVPAEAVQDPWGKNEPAFGRDPSRTPMQWDGSTNAGFSTAAPWLPLSPDWRTRNVAAAGADPGSLLNLYRRLLALRRARPALHGGAWAPLAVAGEVFAFERRAGAERLVVALNFGAEPQRLHRPDLAGARVLLSTAGREEGATLAQADLRLAPDEGVILEPVG